MIPFQCDNVAAGLSATVVGSGESIQSSQWRHKAASTSSGPIPLRQLGNFHHSAPVRPITSNPSAEIEPAMSEIYANGGRDVRTLSINAIAAEVPWAVRGGGNSTSRAITRA